MYSTEKTAATHSNHSTDKALAIIEYLSVQAEPVRLQQISKDTGINGSTALRFLFTLEKNGYVIHDEDSLKYSLSMKICTIAHNVVKNNSVVKVASPFLRVLSDSIGESVCLSVERNQAVVYVDTHDGKDQMLKSLAFIGKVAPLHCTGTGKLFLSNYSDERLSAYVDSGGLKVNTINTLVTLEGLKFELDKVRANGYSVDNEECELGARCIAVPIRNYSGNVVAGVSVTGPTTRMTFDFIYGNLPRLLEVSREISGLLGYVDEAVQI